MQHYHNIHLFLTIPTDSSYLHEILHIPSCLRTTCYKTCMPFPFSFFYAPSKYSSRVCPAFHQKSLSSKLLVLSYVYSQIKGHISTQIRKENSRRTHAIEAEVNLKLFSSSLFSDFRFR